MLAGRGSVARRPRWGSRCFAENEEFDESANQENNRQLAKEQALSERETCRHGERTVLLTTGKLTRTDMVVDKEHLRVIC